MGRQGWWFKKLVLNCALELLNLNGDGWLLLEQCFCCKWCVCFPINVLSQVGSSYRLPMVKNLVTLHWHPMLLTWSKWASALSWVWSWCDEFLFVMNLTSSCHNKKSMVNLSYNIKLINHFLCLFKQCWSVFFCKKLLPSYSFLFIMNVDSKQSFLLSKVKHDMTLQKVMFA
jgi:hypothetical protein